MKLLAIALGVTALCRADLITFASLPNAQYAATSPVPTPPGEIVFPGSEWLTPIAPGPQIYEQEFFIPFGFDIVGASIGIKTNGPTAASAIQTITGVFLGGAAALGIGQHIASALKKTP